MGRRSSRRRLTLNTETLGRLTLSPAELHQVVGGAATYTCLVQYRLASGSKYCQSGN
jgi:hypothetical protein